MGIQVQKTGMAIYDPFKNINPHIRGQAMLVALNIRFEKGLKPDWLK